RSAPCRVRQVACPWVGRAAIRVPVLVSATHRAAAHRRRAHATAHAHAARAALAFMDARYLVLVILAGVIAALHFVHRHGSLSGIAQSQVADLGLSDAGKRAM